MKLSSRERRERRKMERWKRNAPKGKIRLYFFLNAWDVISRAYIKRLNEEYWRVLPDYL